MLKENVTKTTLNMGSLAKRIFTYADVYAFIKLLLY